jgi:hypothetical protein
MLSTRYDAPVSEAEWKEVLTVQGFGQLIAAGRKWTQNGVLPPATTQRFRRLEPSPFWRIQERSRCCSSARCGAGSPGTGTGQVQVWGEQDGRAPGRDRAPARGARA